MKKLLQIITVLIIIVGIIMLAFSYVATIVYADEGYPAPIDTGYPVDYPIDTGYPIYDPYPVIGYPIFEGYPDPLYPEPSSNPVQLQTVEEPTFIEEFQAEVETAKQIIEQPKQKTRPDIRVTIKHLVYIVQHYGKMLFVAR